MDTTINILNHDRDQIPIQNISQKVRSIDDSQPWCKGKEGSSKFSTDFPSVEEENRSHWFVAFVPMGIFEILLITPRDTVDADLNSFYISKADCTVLHQINELINRDIFQYWFLEMLIPDVSWRCENINCDESVILLLMVALPTMIIHYGICAVKKMSFHMSFFLMLPIKPIHVRYRMSGKSVASEHRIILGYYRYHAPKDQMR
jgi:hypothetical protein